MGYLGIAGYLLIFAIFFYPNVVFLFTDKPTCEVNKYIDFGPVFCLADIYLQFVVLYNLPLRCSKTCG